MLTIPDRIQLLEKVPPPPEAASDNDPVPDLQFTDYKPYCAAQVEFHETMCRYRWQRGGLGSGKTRSIIEHLNLYLCTVLWHMAVVVLIGAHTYRHLMDTTIPVLKIAFPPQYLRGGSWEKGWSKGDMCLYLRNGSIIACRTAHNGKYKDWRGAQYAAFVMDEGRNFPNRDPWVTANTRVRLPGVPECLLQLWMGSTTNGYDWQYDEFHGKYRTEDHRDFLLLTKDNPHLPNGYYEFLRASMDEDEARQELDGEFISRQGAVYPNLSRKLWPEGNILEAYQDRSLPTDVAIDWGYRNPRVVFFQQRQALCPESCVMKTVDAVVHEWKMVNGKAPKDKTLDDMVVWLHEQRELGWNIRRVFCDPAGDSANEHEHITSAQRVAKELAVSVLKPRLPWQRSKVNGEKVVRARIKAADGERRLVWLSKPGSNGEHVYAENHLSAHQGLMFEDAKDGRPQKEVSLKDGINDHDTDLSRYILVPLYGRETLSAAQLMRRAAA